MASIVDVQGLSRQFGPTTALDAVDFRATQGLVHGLVGVNGAGKTTLIKHLLGLLRPTRGSVRMFGLDPVRHPVEVLRRVGYLSEYRELPEWMRIDELLRYTQAYYPSWDMTYARELLDTFGLDGARKVAGLSQGMRAQTGLVVAVAPRPEVLILDEPSSGLDAVVRQDILDAIVRTVADDGRTVIFSSHLLDEVERMSDHVTMIHDGKVVLNGSRGLPVLAIGLILALCVPLLVAFGNAAQADGGGIIVLMCVTIVPALPFFAAISASFWNRDASLRAPMNPFEATRPIATARLAAVQIAVAVGGILGAWALIATSLWFSLSVVRAETPFATLPQTIAALLRSAPLGRVAGVALVGLVAFSTAVALLAAIRAFAVAYGKRLWFGALGLGLYAIFMLFAVLTDRWSGAAVGAHLWALAAAIPAGTAFIMVRAVAERIVLPRHARAALAHPSRPRVHAGRARTGARRAGAGRRVAAADREHVGRVVAGVASTRMSVGARFPNAVRQTSTGVALDERPLTDRDRFLLFAAATQRQPDSLDQALDLFAALRARRVPDQARRVVRRE
jgi:ABC-2 type transport system ATP-binding protein